MKNQDKSTKNESLNLDYGKRRKERQQFERQERKKKWQALSPLQQLEYLDKVFGKDKGAGKQRAKIQAKLKNVKTEKKEKANTPNNTSSRSNLNKFKGNKVIKWRQKTRNKVVQSRD